jgi:hypothetical protein
VVHFGLVRNVKSASCSPTTKNPPSAPACSKAV